MARSSSESQVLSTEAPYAAWSRRLNASDREAFEELFRATYDALFGYAQRLTRQPQAAEDIVQEAFFRIWAHRTTLDPHRSLRALLYVTVRNLALSQRRTVAKRQHLLTIMDEHRIPPTPEETTNARLLRGHIRHWIAELPERRREAFELSRFDGLSYLEIAQVMEISVKTVDNHIWLALQHLRRRLLAFEPDRLPL